MLPQLSLGSTGAGQRVEWGRLKREAPTCSRILSGSPRQRGSWPNGPACLGWPLSGSWPAFPPSADYTPTRMKVSKSCVPSCFETVYDGYSKHASTTSCCQYDLCNGAGFATPATLALALILLATLWGLF